jgi:hypothetical protein
MINMTNKLPKVCVIILSWNHKKDVLENVKSLQASNQNGFKMQISVIDNGSTDGTVEELTKLKIKVKELDKNYGYVVGNNMGMEEAIEEGFDYIALLNDDTLVDADLVRNILLEHRKNEKAGAISPKIYFAKGFEYHKKYEISDLGHVIWYAGGRVDWENIYGSNRGVDEVDHGQFEKTEETDFATGCFVMYKAKALREVGLFDKKYFAYMEDVDLSQRMKREGWAVLYSPKGHLWHKVSQSSGIGSEQNDYYMTRNRMLFGMKYGSLRTILALIRESLKLLLSGRQWQKIGIRDYYLGRFGKGSWE